MGLDHLAISEFQEALRGKGLWAFATFSVDDHKNPHYLVAQHLRATESDQPRGIFFATGLNPEVDKIHGMW